MRTLNFIYILWIIILILLGLHSLASAEMAMLHSFNKGELTEKLAARSDVTPYYSGARLMENFYCQVHGGASKRQGTYFIAEVADSSKAARAIPFSKSTEENYVLVFGDKTIGFCK